jgi:hypothetical protein
MLISLPNEENEFSTKAHRQLMPQNYNNRLMVNSLLKEVNEDTKWPIEISCPGSLTDEILQGVDLKHHSYIMFTWSEGDRVQNLRDQLNEIETRQSWNPRANFFVVVLGHHTQRSPLLAQQIAEMLWKHYMIMDAVILISEEEDILSHDMNNRSLETPALLLFTWIPYKDKKCSEIDIFLIDTWLLDDTGRFRDQALLFPIKIPKNFLQCPVRVYIPSVIPFSMLKEKFTDEKNCTSYSYVGYEVEYFKLIAQALNFSILYREVPPGSIPETHKKGIDDVLDGFSDITFGGYPLHLLITQMLDPTIPYAKEYLKWYVPCGKPIPRSEKVANIFTLPMWLTIFFVFVSAAVAMRQLSKHSKLFEFESQSFRDISICFYNVWAVSMGMPVSHMPRNSRIRFVILCLVWYCFAIRTLFQTCFTSILVNPGTIDQIRTIEELYKSDLVYFRNDDMDTLMQFTVPDYHKGIRLKKKECGNWGASMTEYLKSHQGATVSFGVFTEYAVTSLVPAGSEEPQLCTLRENIYTLDYTMYFRKGSPLLGTFNNVIRRIMETGLVLKSMNDFKTSFRYMNWSSNLKLPYQIKKANNDYTVFSLYHLKLTFCVLALGCVMSCAIFVGELLCCKVFK